MTQSGALDHASVTAALDGVFGLALGIALIPLATRVIGPLFARLSGQGKAAP